jgi:excisionase family DNA binding protein
VDEVLTIDPAHASEHEWLDAVRSYIDKAKTAGEVVSIRSRPESLTPAEAGRRLNMSRSTIIRKIASGEIRALKVGSHHRIPPWEFESYRDRLIGDMIAATSDDIEGDLNGD